MNNGIEIRNMCILFFCCGIAAVSGLRERKEASTEIIEGKGLRYTRYLTVYTLPAFIFILLIFSSVYYGWGYSSRLLLSWCFGAFLHISLFYLVLLAVMPFLRKYFSARSCAELWLLPNLLYMVEHSVLALEEPWLVITLPQAVIEAAIILWGIGFAVVFAGYLLSHLVFRHRILKDAVPVNDSEIFRIWQKEREYANFQKDFRLVISPNTRTPLSVGLFKKTTQIVLPPRAYSAEELRWIFRHELVHIGREDSGNKFFIMFCTAFCWFHPLMWLAMRKSAEDLELSCDETVLLNADEEDRKKYAELILQTAGDSHGFTTCLSASASAMRYRLRNIVKRRKRLNGGVIVGLLLFGFMMTSGYISLAYETGNGEDWIFYSGTAEENSLHEISFRNGTGYDYYNCTDVEAFKRYLAELELVRITGNYAFENNAYRIFSLFRGKEGVFSVTLMDDVVKVVPLYGEEPRIQSYYLTSEVDWEYLSSLFVEQINYYEEGLPVQPELRIQLEDGESEELTCQGVVFNVIVDGKVTESIDPTDIPAELVFSDLQTDVMIIGFSHSVYGDYTIEVENWDRTETVVINMNDFIAADRFKLMPYDAHYNVYASFKMEDGKMLEMVFKFDVELP